MTIHFYATRENYVDHLAPIWHAMRPEARGRFYISPLNTMQMHADALGIPALMQDPPRRCDTCTIVVAGGGDLAGVKHAVLVEHGAGQSYVEVDHESWSGGPSRDHVELFIVPNRFAAAQNAKRYPHTPQLICAPRVEWLRTLGFVTEYRYVFGRHWDSSLAPELSSAWPHHFETIRDFVLANRASCALHFHPRCADIGRTLASEWGVPYLSNFSEVVRTARCFITDNSSCGFEMVACGKQTLWLNAPWYRRNLENGLRFWSHAGVAPQADTPEQLHDFLLHGTTHTDYNPKLIHEVFPVIDGSAKMAAAAIEALEAER